MVKVHGHQAFVEQPVSAKEFMDEIIHHFYPQLLTQINDITAEIQLHPTHAAGYQLLSLAASISSEMEQLFQMEKDTLFPYIARLVAENQKSESCKLFKETKLHYTAMLQYICKLKAELTRLEPGMLPASAILNEVQIFEQQHIFLQVNKNKYLFAPNKSCTGCKAL